MPTTNEHITESGITLTNGFVAILELEDGELIPDFEHLQHGTSGVHTRAKSIKGGQLRRRDKTGTASSSLQKTSEATTDALPHLLNPTTMDRTDTSQNPSSMHLKGTSSSSLHPSKGQQENLNSTSEAAEAKEQFPKGEPLGFEANEASFHVVVGLAATPWYQGAAQLVPAAETGPNLHYRQ